MGHHTDDLKELIKWSLARLGFQLTRLGETNDLNSHLVQIFSKLKIDCVLDVGAHRGEYGVLLRRLGYRGRIVSFEPVPENYASLASLCAADGDWRAHACALGNCEGEAEINVLAGSTFSSILSPTEFGRRSFGQKMDVERRLRVRVRRLESLFDECVVGLVNPRVFLKTDTQGFDLMAISGAGRKLDAVVALQTEVAIMPIYQSMSNHFVDTITTLEKEGFGVTGLFPVTRDPTDGLRIIELDCVMCRP